MSPPWKSKENTKIATPPRLDTPNEDSKDDLSVSKRPTLAKSKSQPKVAGTKSKLISFLRGFSVSDNCCHIYSSSS
jgi:hypothetical protein